MMTTEELNAARQFWKWFEENHLPFEFLESMPQDQQTALYATAHDLLAAYCGGLDIKPTINQGPTAQSYQLVISASGNAEYFDEAKELVAMAPTIPNWTIMALVPPLPPGTELRYSFNNEYMYPSDLWCQLLESPEDPDFLGLRLSLRLYDRCPPEQLEDLRVVLIQVVALTLGEESWAANIQYLDLAPLPDDPTTEDAMFPFSELPEKIAFFRNERRGLQ